MTYAGERLILDADSHVMELADFLDDFIDPGQRDRLRRAGMEALGPVLAAAVEKAEARRATPAEAAEAEERLHGRQGLDGHGRLRPRRAQPGARPARLSKPSSSSPPSPPPCSPCPATSTGTRTRPSWPPISTASTPAARPRTGPWPTSARRTSGCWPSPIVSLVDPARAAAAAEEAIAGGCAAVMVPSTAAGDRAPTHPDLDAFWDVLDRTDIPFVLHVGGGGRLLDPAFHNNDMPVTDHLGGGENIRSKDYLAIYHSPELFLGRPDPRRPVRPLSHACGAAASSRGPAGSCPGCTTSTTRSAAFRRTEEPLRRLAVQALGLRAAAPQVHSVPGGAGRLDDRAGRARAVHVLDRLPAPRRGPGSRWPSSRRPSTETDEADRERFYSANMAELMGGKLARTPR